MMRNRAIQVSLVKKDRPSETPYTGGVVEPSIDVDHLNDLVKDQVQHIAMTIGGLLLAKKAADTLSELILIAGRKHL